MAGRADALEAAVMSYPIDGIPPIGHPLRELYDKIDQLHRVGYIDIDERNEYLSLMIDGWSQVRADIKAAKESGK